MRERRNEEDPIPFSPNRLSERQRVTAEVIGLPLFRGGHGFGMGVAVVLDKERAEPTICRGHEGAVGWPGSFGVHDAITRFQALASADRADRSSHD